MITEILYYFNDQAMFNNDHFKTVLFEIAYEKFIRSRFLKQTKQNVWELIVDFNGEFYNRIHF